MAQISEMQHAAAQFGVTNRVIADDMGYGSYYVAIPKMTNAQLLAGGDANVHPAFIVNGVTKEEILIGKYHAFVKNDRAYSLPNVTPGTHMNFDQSVAYCKNKGNGHHLITCAEYAMLALWAKLKGTLPRGNTDWGASSEMPSEIGISATKETDGEFKTMSTKTCASFPSWYHNGDLNGIDGLCGNLWHWCGGLRLHSGEINIFANNDAAMLNIDMSAAGEAWKAIMPNGSLVAPGTEGTLKWDYAALPIDAMENIKLGTILNFQQQDVNAYGDTTFSRLTAKTGVTVPAVLKSLALFPNDADGYKDDMFWMRNNGERLPLRGGSFHNGASAGVFALNVRVDRSLSNHTVGFRVAYCDM